MPRSMARSAATRRSRPWCSPNGSPPVTATMTVRHRLALGAGPVTDRLIKITTALAVVAVAVVAAVISYQHAYERVRAHGESGLTTRLLPFAVDGLIWAASMVVPDASRRNQPVPQLAAWSLGTGIVATIGANLAHGMGHGPVGALVSAWPALALVGSFELLMMLIRTGRSTRAGGTGAEPRYQPAPPPAQKHRWNCRLCQAWSRRFAHGTRRARVSAPLPESSTSTAERSSASSIQRHDSANRLGSQSRYVTADTEFRSLLTRLIPRNGDAFGAHRCRYS